MRLQSFFILEARFLLDLGFPTLMLFKNGLNSPVTYYGPHDEVGIKYFLLEQIRGLEETQPVYSKVKCKLMFHKFMRDEFKSTSLL